MRRGAEGREWQSRRRIGEWGEMRGVVRSGERWMEQKRLRVEKSFSGLGLYSPLYT